VSEGWRRQRHLVIVRLLAGFLRMDERKPLLVNLVVELGSRDLRHIRAGLAPARPAVHWNFGINVFDLVLVDI
jgi:hypothetical protein